MKILVLTPDLRDKGGVGNYYKCLKLDDEPNIDYFFVNRSDTPSIMSPGVTDKLILLKKVFQLACISLKFLLLVPRYQLVHINPSLTPGSFYRDMFFIGISRIFGRKLLVFFRGWNEEFEDGIIRNKVMSYLFRNTFGKADNIIVLGKSFEKKLIRMGVNPSTKIYYESTVADSSFLDDFDMQKKASRYARKVNFLFMSRILKPKGIYIAIDAFTKSQEALKNRDMAFYVAGEGEELEPAKRYVKENGYTNIYFIGDTRGEEKKRVLLESHIFLFPTYHGEGQPNCILEAMLYGMPVVTRIHAGIPEVVSHGKNGLLTDSLDSSVFAEYCIRLASNETLYLEMAYTNLAYARQEFATEKVRERILGIYRQIA